MGYIATYHRRGNQHDVSAEKLRLALRKCPRDGLDGSGASYMATEFEAIFLFRTSASYGRRAGLPFPSKISWAEARMKKHELP